MNSWHHNSFLNKKGCKTWYAGVIFWGSRNDLIAKDMFSDYFERRSWLVEADPTMGRPWADGPVSGCSECKVCQVSLFAVTHRREHISYTYRYTDILYMTSCDMFLHISLCDYDGWHACSYLLTVDIHSNVIGSYFAWYSDCRTWTSSLLICFLSRRSSSRAVSFRNV